ncbi:hypothetical protein HLI18_19840 [Rhizobium laguerreae]|uniref:hypothetical protein n=1 Tax=Rhizobium laguerreae TaxID=1076926 RepID=UPI0014788AD6|nr:hypothetical protein [Rhizobium laguerreae]NNG72082.1 hypothetical protein [Rhizobium laguerreae]
MTAGNITVATAEIIKEVTKAVTIAMFPLGATIVKTIENSSKEVDDASSKGIDELRDEISKQTLRQGFELQQAKIAQELAIAHRITNAETVEIEEFYDTSMTGKAGLETKETGVMFGIGGERQRVTKRIYKFSGHAVPAVNVVPNEIETDSKA